MIYKPPNVWLTGCVEVSRELVDKTVTVETVEAEGAAQELLTRHGIVEPPTPVEDLAAGYGIMVIREPFEDDGVSGVLIREPHRNMIIVNAANAAVRQRFTIAHEIGHFRLHDGAMYLDGRARVNFRDGLSSMATDHEEIEANAFAAALLMPAPWVRSAFEDAVRAAGINSEDELAELLGARFNVSRQAMLIRLTNLGLIASP
jgi:Zn-dependent peptidase ImmA (M78 family)